MNMIWANMREEEFAQAIEASQGICVMPVGCLEMHGQHLPVGTDILKASYILRRAAEIEHVCVFPDFSFGDVQGLTTHKGSIRLTIELEQWLMIELCREIARNGFDKIMLFNSHGGNNAFLNTFVSSTRRSGIDYTVRIFYNQIGKFAHPAYMLDLIRQQGREVLPELTDDDLSVLQDFVDKKKKGGHACFMETAVMLGCYPELVRMDRINEVSGISTEAARYLDEAGLNKSTRFWGVNYPNSYAGHAPEGCNRRIGDAAVRLLTDDLVQALRAWKDEANATQP